MISPSNALVMAMGLREELPQQILRTRALKVITMGALKVITSTLNGALEWIDTLIAS